MKEHLATENQNRIIEKTLVKKLKESSKKESNIVWYPKTATIERTWIQRDSNFTSLRGLESYLSL